LREEAELLFCLAATWKIGIEENVSGVIATFEALGHFYLLS